MSAADGLLTGLADGLRRHVRGRAEAEARLADFAFREGAGDRPDPILAIDWRYFVARTLAVVGESGTLDLLDRLATGEETLASLARDRAGDLDGPLAAADRIGGLAAAGLAGRDLETGRVGLTALGAAVLAFAQEWERLARAAEPTDERGRA